MPSNRERDLSAGNTFAVVANFDRLDTATQYEDLDAPSTCIDGILDELLDDGCGALDHLPRSNLADRLRVEGMDLRHERALRSLERILRHMQPHSRRPSISTRRGDTGETSSPGSGRVSKGELRVEASGVVDELKSFIGLARAFCEDADLCALAKEIQRDLFAIGSAISTKPGGRRPVPEIGDEMVARLDRAVAELEATPGLVRDWTLPGELRSSAAFDCARTVCSRAARTAVRLMTSGAEIQKNVLAYLNRLSDVLWLCARVLEARAGVDARLRDERHPGPPWSRAW